MVSLFFAGLSLWLIDIHATGQVMCKYFHTCSASYGCEVFWRILGAYSSVNCHGKIWSSKSGFITGEGLDCSIAASECMVALSLKLAEYLTF